MSPILAGPRGRRLCLELVVALAGDDDGASALSRAVFYAGHHLDPGRGSSRTVFGWNVPDPLPQPSPADVARLVDEVPLPEPDERAVLHALAATVDSARYWQEPDGEDVLAATPEVTAALERVASHLTACGVVGGWGAPADMGDQWVVSFAGVPPAEELPAAERLAHWSSETRAAEAAAARDYPDDPREPISGPWWSTPPVGILTSTGCLGELGPRGLWLVEDSVGWTSAAVRRAAETHRARVYEVDGAEAWVELCRRHPLDVTVSRRHDWFRATGVDRQWVLPDWSQVATEVGAVHLTVAGYLATAGRALDVGNGRHSVVAGWDPDATYWFTDDVRPASAEVAWERADDGEWRTTAS